MLGDLDHIDLIWPPFLSAEDLDRQRLLDDWFGQLAQIAAQIAGNRAALKSREEKQNRALRVARKSSVSAATLYEQAERAGRIEADIAKIVQPIIAQLLEISDRFAESTADKIDLAIRRYAEEGIDIGVSWLELAQNYRLECLRIASEKGGAGPIISSADELEREFDSLTGDEG
jgi:hypothetical protein